MSSAGSKPIVLITGAAGNLGRSVAAALADGYQIVGRDRQARAEGPDGRYPILAVDLGADESVAAALQAFGQGHGTRIASVVHLAAYFDFTGEDNPLYQSVNVDGTRRLLQALQGFEVGQFLYPSTMLVHAPCRPGEHGHIPSAVLRLAGVYDTQTMVPTLAQQMARIHERDLQSHLYAGSLLVGPSALHRDDMLAALRRAVDRREQLPGGTEILIVEADDHMPWASGARANCWAGRPRRRLADELPAMVASLKSDPAAWYAAKRR